MSGHEAPRQRSKSHSIAICARPSGLNIFLPATFYLYGSLQSLIPIFVEAFERAEPLSSFHASPQMTFFPMAMVTFKPHGNRLFHLFTQLFPSPSRKAPILSKSDGSGKGSTTCGCSGTIAPLEQTQAALDTAASLSPFPHLSQHQRQVYLSTTVSGASLAEQAQSMARMKISLRI
jgi:hypothetical protein